MSYVIFGRHIAKEYLAFGVLSSTTIGALALTRGGKKAEPAAGLSPAAKAREVVPITADSNEEVEFIKAFLAEAEKDEAKH